MAVKFSPMLLIASHYSRTRGLAMVMMTSYIGVVRTVRAVKAYLVQFWRLVLITASQPAHLPAHTTAC